MNLEDHPGYDPPDDPEAKEAYDAAFRFSFELRKKAEREGWSEEKKKEIWAYIERGIRDRAALQRIREETGIDNYFQN